MCFCTPEIKTPFCGKLGCRIEDCKEEGVADVRELKCGTSMHVWPTPDVEGNTCVCGSVYQPRKPKTESIFLHKGQLFTKHGWEFSAPVDGNYQFTIMPHEPSINQHAALMVLRLS